MVGLFEKGGFAVFHHEGVFFVPDPDPVFCARVPGMADPPALTGGSAPSQSARTYAKTRGATIVASLSMMYLRESRPSFPQVIFSLGTAPL
jgi:hypothetical protein